MDIEIVRSNHKRAEVALWLDICYTVAYVTANVWLMIAVDVSENDHVRESSRLC